MSGRAYAWKMGPTITALLALVVTAVTAPTSLSNLVPASEAVAGWEALDADKAATSPDELWKIYNGGDGEWKAAGVTSAFLRYYKHKDTGQVVTLHINRTGTDWRKAKAKYADEEKGLKELDGYESVQIKAAGSLARSGPGVSGHFWAKYYYCTVEVNGTSAQDVSAAKGFMTKLSATITEKG